MIQLQLIKSKEGYEKSKCLISHDDKVLFIEEATYLYIETPELLKQPEKYFFLKEDLILRGIIASENTDDLSNIIDYKQMVKLVKETKKTITWF